MTRMARNVVIPGRFWQILTDVAALQASPARIRWFCTDGRKRCQFSPFLTLLAELCKKKRLSIASESGFARFEHSCTFLQDPYRIATHPAIRWILRCPEKVHFYIHPLPTRCEYRCRSGKDPCQDRCQKGPFLHSPGRRRLDPRGTLYQR